MKVGIMQPGSIFYENLSVIDVMMFNSVKEIQNMLNNYRLLNEFCAGELAAVYIIVFCLRSFCLQRRRHYE